MPIEVSVQLSLDVARVLHKQAPSTEASEDLARLMEDLGQTLEPIHPGADDVWLIPFFRVWVPDQSTADKVIAALSESEAVEGAYITPPAALP